MAERWVGRRTKEPSQPGGPEPGHGQNDETADNATTHSCPDASQECFADDARKKLFPPRVRSRRRLRRTASFAQPKKRATRKKRRKIGQVTEWQLPVLPP